MSKLSKKETRILALDQASTYTGYAVFDGTKLIKWGLLDASKWRDDSKIRIKEMSAMIADLVRTYDPDLVLMEGVTKQRSIQVLILLAQLQGCIINICNNGGCDFVVYEPTSWRSQLGFNQGSKVSREELKKQAITLVRNCYKLKVNEDVCEGICIGLSHLKRTNMITDFTGLKKARNYKEKSNGKGIKDKN